MYVNLIKINFKTSILKSVIKFYFDLDNLNEGADPGFSKEEVPSL